MNSITRRNFLAQIPLIGLAPSLLSLIAEKKMISRPIPSSGELMSVIGLGTWQTFDANQASMGPLKEVLRTLVDNGASVVDSSPMYGRSEKVVGNLSTELKINDKLFIATKVWTTGKDEGIHQMKESMSLLQRKKIDLMQIHNLVDWKTHLRTLQDWKEGGMVRYIGITHYVDSSHAALAEVIKNYPIDFVQVNYSIADRNAESHLLPLAREKKVGVLVNRPFEEGALFQRTKGKSLPEWAAEFDCASWGQFFLKFILSHPAVNCVIPGTGKANHLLDNLGAGYGVLPDQSQRDKMIRYYQSL